MKHFLALTTLLVRDYDEAIEFFVARLRFALIEDTALSDTKRWVVVAPRQTDGGGVLLAKADTPAQEARIGDQTGGRVGFFLHTDDFWRDYENYQASGVEFVRGEPRDEPYGTVAVFKDLYGNLWDLIEPKI